MRQCIRSKFNRDRSSRLTWARPVHGRLRHSRPLLSTDIWASDVEDGRREIRLPASASAETIPLMRKFILPAWQDWNGRNIDNFRTRHIPYLTSRCTSHTVTEDNCNNINENQPPAELKLLKIVYDTLNVSCCFSGTAYALITNGKYTKNFDRWRFHCSRCTAGSWRKAS